MVETVKITGTGFDWMNEQAARRASFSSSANFMAGKSLMQFSSALAVSGGGVSRA